MYDNSYGGSEMVKEEQLIDTRGEKKATGQAQRVQKVKAESQEQTVGDQE